MSLSTLTRSTSPSSCSSLWTWTTYCSSFKSSSSMSSSTSTRSSSPSTCSYSWTCTTYSASFKSSFSMSLSTSTRSSSPSMSSSMLGYERNRNHKALTKNLPRIRLLVSVLGLRNFQIPGRYAVIGFTILDIIG
jgi:hypothetical protein